MRENIDNHDDLFINRITSLLVSGSAKHLLQHPHNLIRITMLCAERTYIEEWSIRESSGYGCCDLPREFVSKSNTRIASIVNYHVARRSLMRFI